MAEIIQDGTGTGYAAKVNAQNRLEVKAVTQSHVATVSEDDGQAYIVEAIDAGPVAAEYTLYLKNDSDNKMVIDNIDTWVTDADVVWKLWEVTGTAAGAAVITPQNLNLSAGKNADATCRGGAGGVTGLTVSGSVKYTWKTGIALSHYRLNTNSSLILSKNDAIAFEYDAGTGGLAHLNLLIHYHG